MDRRHWYPISASSRQVQICFNPSAGSQSRQKQVEAIGSELTRRGYQVRTSTNPDEFGRQTAQATASQAGAADQTDGPGGLRAVVACGGDGTAALVRNRVPLDIPLLPVPTGTESLLGGYLEQSATSEAVGETLDRGVIIPMDLCRATDNQSNSRYFLIMISAGFDAAVVRRLHENRRGHITRASYLQPILHTIRSYQYPEIRLYCDVDSRAAAEPIRGHWLFGFNLPLYARGWQFAPHASGLDGRLDVCTFRHGSFLDGVRYFWHVLRKTHLRLPDTELTVGQRLRIEAAGATEVPYQVDGDYAGILPVDVEVLPAALKLMVLPRVAEKLGFSPPETPLT